MLQAPGTPTGHRTAAAGGQAAQVAAIPIHIASSCCSSGRVEFPRNWRKHDEDSC